MIVSVLGALRITDRPGERFKQGYYIDMANYTLERCNGIFPPRVLLQYVTLS